MMVISAQERLDDVVVAVVEVAAEAGESGTYTADVARTLAAVVGKVGARIAAEAETRGFRCGWREAVDAVSARLGRRLKFVVGKPGLDGHSNGAEQIAFRARDCGIDITYDGIRLTPEQIVAAAVEQHLTCT